MQFYISGLKVFHILAGIHNSVSPEKGKKITLWVFLFLFWGFHLEAYWCLRCAVCVCARERGAAVFQLQPDDDDNSWLDCWRTGRRYVSLVFKGDGGAHARESRERGRDDDWVGFFLPKCCHFTSFHQGYHNNLSIRMIRLYIQQISLLIVDRFLSFFFRVWKRERNITCSSSSINISFFSLFLRFYGAFHLWCVVVGGDCGHYQETCSRKSHDFSRRIPTGTIARTKKFSHFHVVVISLPYLQFNNNIYHVPLGYLTECRIPPANNTFLCFCFFISKQKTR